MCNAVSRLTPKLYVRDYKEYDRVSKEPQAAYFSTGTEIPKISKVVRVLEQFLGLFQYISTLN